MLPKPSLVNKKPLRRNSRFHVGLRVVKTAIAVTVAAAIGGAFSTVSVFYAAMGALVGMDRTISDSLKSCLVQMVGVILGGLFGFVITELSGEAPFWLIGIGVLLDIVVCVTFRLNYAVSLSCIVLISLATYPVDSVWWETVTRLRDTGLGLAVALLVNVTIRPYNNARRIVALLQQMVDEVPSLAQICVLEERYPDLRHLNDILDQVDAELKVYHRQRFFRKREQVSDAAYLDGCRQLGLRMLQELEAICFMDTFGNIGVENSKRLAELGLSVPEDMPRRKCSKHDTIVMNYHLEKLLDARLYLQQLLAAAPAAASAPANGAEKPPVQ